MDFQEPAKPLPLESANRYAAERRNSLPRYEETCEVIRVRDSEGDFVIRRPILSERDTDCVGYEGTHRAHLEWNASRPACTRSVHGISFPGARSATRPSPTCLGHGSAIGPRAGNDTASFYQGYNPRYQPPIPNRSVGHNAE
ncbi:hypothetical protein CMUS01_01091 [Colletotrichum musicola]|uniref:Uncharacterized protein n=1 Tax=Colletotrichum musicola TaxID=2175873 RepID=A0A8H6NXJ0_9PEZI|nr:hypothetical protein CMUS01_01091 [Colletotrichum musicola]